MGENTPTPKTDAELIARVKELAAEVGPQMEGRQYWQKRAEAAEAERDRLQQSLTAVRAELVAERQQVAALVTGRKS